MQTPRYILPLIVIAQLCCTSLWFASNAVIGDLATNFGLGYYALGNLTAAVQFGFIIGTLLFALLTIADRFSPSRVFFFSALAGALFNLGMLLPGNTLLSLLVLRFLCGFFLAGIYPIGMKIAADHYDKGLGKSLGFLVGALVLGTACPHFLNSFGTALPWRSVLLATSGSAALGGLLMYLFVPNGPYRKSSSKLDLSALFVIFKNRGLRSAAFGYFGHMWELYAFWTFVPVMLATYNSIFPKADLPIPLLSFAIIGIGGLACVLGAYWAAKSGTKRIASASLLLSGLCCVASPLFFLIGSSELFIAVLLFWGMVVIADSPLFSTLVAQHTTAELKGTALTIVNCIGFSLTIVSIQLLNMLRDMMDPTYLYMLLALGPLFGLIGLRMTKKA